MPITEPDYLQMWNDLATRRQSVSSFAYFDNRQNAEQFEASSREKNRGKREVLLDFVKSELRPEDTVLDIGAGTGRWPVPLAGIASRVTAIEPALSMSEILTRNAAEAGVSERIAVVVERPSGARVRHF